MRTRFATDGLPIGWLTDEEVARGTAAADVAMRDPLRREEGSVAVGYTIEEAVLLLRSTHPHLQRAGARHAPRLLATRSPAAHLLVTSHVVKC